MNSRIPPVLHPLLQEYTQRVTRELPVLVSAFFLEGSIALDGFHPRLSDVDFVAVVSRQLTTPEFEKLWKIHQRIEQTHPQWKLSGGYFQPGDLGCRDDRVQPFPNYHDGKLKWSERFGLSAVTWWILKEHGIPVFGPRPESLGYTVDLNYLVQTQLENLNSYWGGYTTRPDGLLALLSDWGVQWTVLGVLRQFYTLREHAIVSKIAAGEYALARMPERWHRIIREAIGLRKDSEPCSYYTSRMTRAVETYGFIRYVIRTCNAVT